MKPNNFCGFLPCDFAGFTLKIAHFRSFRTVIISWFHLALSRPFKLYFTTRLLLSNNTQVSGEESKATVTFFSNKTSIISFIQKPPKFRIEIHKLPCYDVIGKSKD